jgi:ferredoxin
MERLRVDWIRCEGYGLCGDYAPEVIDLDDWRYPILRPGPVDAAFMNVVRRAVDCCPMKALILEPVSADDRGRSGRGHRWSGPSKRSVRG